MRRIYGLLVRLFIVRLMTMNGDFFGLVTISFMSFYQEIFFDNLVLFRDLDFSFFRYSIKD